MDKRKITALALASAMLITTSASPVMAAAGDVKISLGADLTAHQQEEVLSLLSVSEAELAESDVIYVTNEEEHAYLDSYVDYDTIGDAALSSSKVVLQEEGHGITVTTYNINYCTTGMYQNALLTAGVEDADVYVAGPEKMSGTAALIGIMKAYDAATDGSLNEENIDAATQELAVTSEIAQATGADPEDVELIIAELKTMLDEIAGMDDASIDNMIVEVSQKYGVTFSDENVVRVRELLKTLSTLDLDSLLDKAMQLYENFTNMLQNSDGAQGILDSIGSFLSGIFSTISDWIKGLF
jgi:uncharacterized protein YpuA (DUF1002 family)